MNAATILVVENDPANRELIVELLEAHGYQVCQAKDGYTAIDMARTERPRLILMNLGFLVSMAWRPRGASGPIPPYGLFRLWS